MLISANFGSARSGLATVGYQLLNADKSEYAARTTTGVTELGDGIYGVTVADATLLGRSVVWDTGEASEVYASETFPDYAVAGDEMDLVDAPNVTAVTAIQANLATSANQTTILNRLGAFTGTGINTVLGMFKALLSKAASAPTDVGGTFDPATDSTEALRDRGDTAYLTATGFSTLTAQQVWEYATRTLSVDEEALAAAIVAAIMEEDMVDETAIALAVATALGSLSVTVASPVGSGGIITLHAGDDYLDAEGRAIAFTIADATHTYLLDDGTAVVKLKSAQATWTATNITSTAGGYIVKFEPEADDTAALTCKQGYEVEATLTSGSVVTLCTGNLVVVRDIPAS